MGERQYIGVDLGTVNSCLAYSDDQGNVSVSVNRDGSALLPSYIIFTKYGKLIGNDAVANTDEYGSPETVFYFKRLMGTDYSRTFRNIQYTPTEMSALILTKLLQNYNFNTGINNSDNMVITVPGDFGEAEKNATISAARIAGIEHIELLNESVAAAISYRNHTKDSADKNIIVYDLGGGTLDVTVMNVKDNRFTVLSDESSKDLGGRDWDLQLATIIQKKVLDSVGLTTDDVISDSEFRKSLITEAEKQKIVLEKNDRAISDVMLRGKHVLFTVTREEFEEATTWLMMKTIEMVGYALRNAGLLMKDIDQIILVGGSTQMPQVKKSLEEAFPSMDILIHDPELAVAKGAAIYARSVFSKKDLKVSSVSTRTIGILGGIDGEEKICNVIYRNLPLPIDRTVMCRPKRDDQDELEITIYESLAKKDEPYIDTTEGKLIFNDTIELPGKIIRGKTKIPIRFIEDSHGRVSITVECNGKIIDFGFSDVSEITAADINKSRSKMDGVL